MGPSLRVHYTRAVGLFIRAVAEVQLSNTSKCVPRINDKQLSNISIAYPRMKDNEPSSQSTCKASLKADRYVQYDVWGKFLLHLIAGMERNSLSHLCVLLFE